MHAHFVSLYIQFRASETFIFIDRARGSHYCTNILPIKMRLALLLFSIYFLSYDLACRLPLTVPTQRHTHSTPNIVSPVMMDVVVETVPKLYLFTHRIVELVSLYNVHYECLLVELLNVTFVPLLRCHSDHKVP